MFLLSDTEALKSSPHSVRITRCKLTSHLTSKTTHHSSVGGCSQALEAGGGGNLHCPQCPHHHGELPQLSKRSTKNQAWLSGPGRASWGPAQGELSVLSQDPRWVGLLILPPESSMRDQALQMSSAEEATELPGSKPLLRSGTLSWAEEGPLSFPLLPAQQYGC